MEAPVPEVLFILNGRDDLAQLQTLAADVNTVTILHREFQLPVLPARVTKLTLIGVKLLGAVTLTEGLKELHIHQSTSTRPIGLWTLPASLEVFQLSSSEFKYLDLSRSQLKELQLTEQETHSSRIKLPASLKFMELQQCWFRRLPKLSAGLEALEIIECPSIEDFSGARDARILSLNFSTGREPMNPASPLALYENFSELRRLSIGSIAGSYPEISLTHLKELSFYNCKSREPIEVNAPNLEILSFEESPDVQLRGNYSTGVTELTLGGYGTFPEGEGWDSLETVRVYSDDPDSKVELPQLPWLRKLETKGGPVLTNGVEVSNILEYKQAWQMRRRVKRVQND